MAKHGGGYLILDLRDNDITDGFRLRVTESQIDAIKTAHKEHLPILYIGPAAESSGFINTDVTAFTYAIKSAAEYAIGVPTSSVSEFLYLPAKIDNGTLTINVV